MDLTTRYLGLHLRNPLLAGASVRQNCAARASRSQRLQDRIDAPNRRDVRRVVSIDANHLVEADVVCDRRRRREQPVEAVAANAAGEIRPEHFEGPAAQLGSPPVDFPCNRVKTAADIVALQIERVVEIEDDERSDPASQHSGRVEKVRT